MGGDPLSGAVFWVNHSDSADCTVFEMDEIEICRRIEELCFDAFLWFVSGTGSVILIAVQQIGKGFRLHTPQFVQVVEGCSA